jgi:hypothetical protein
VSATGLHACAVSAVRLALLVVRARDECVYVYCMQVCPGKCHRQQDGSVLDAAASWTGPSAAAHSLCDVEAHSLCDVAAHSLCDVAADSLCEGAEETVQMASVQMACTSEFIRMV